MPNNWYRLKKTKRLDNRHVQYLCYIFPLIIYIKGLPVISLPLAFLARYINIRKKVHLYLDENITLTRLTTAAFHIKAVSAGPVTPHPRFRYLSIQIPYVSKYACISR